MNNVPATQIKVDEQVISRPNDPRKYVIENHVPFGTFHGGSEIPPGTFHGGSEIPPGAFH